MQSMQVVVSLFETTYILPFPGGMPWLKKKLRPVLGETQECWRNLIFFFLPLVNVGSSPLVNIGAMIFLFSLPSVKLGSSSYVNINACLSTFSKRW